MDKNLFDFVYEKSSENSEPFVIGGGENRTLVLSKLHIDDYMLIALK